MLAIVATTADYVIGGDHGQIPWSCRPDMLHFKYVTAGSLLVVGAKTYKSLAKNWPAGKEFLPGRGLVVLHRNSPEHALRTLVRDEDQWRLKFLSGDLPVTELYSECKEQAKEWNGLFVIGGAVIYDLFASFYDTIYLTTITIPTPITDSNPVHLGVRMRLKMASMSRHCLWKDTDAKTQVAAIFELLVR